MLFGFDGCYAVFRSISRSTFVPSYIAWRRIASRSCCCSKRRVDHWYLWSILSINSSWSLTKIDPLTCRPSNTQLCRKRNCRNQYVWRDGGVRCLRMSTRRRQSRRWYRRENCYESMESEKHRGQIWRSSINKIY